MKRTLNFVHPNYDCTIELIAGNDSLCFSDVEMITFCYLWILLSLLQLKCTIKKSLVIQKIKLGNPKSAKVSHWFDPFHVKVIVNPCGLNHFIHPFWIKKKIIQNQLILLRSLKSQSSNSMVALYFYLANAFLQNHSHSWNSFGRRGSSSEAIAILSRIDDWMYSAMYTRWMKEFHHFRNLYSYDESHLLWLCAQFAYK